MLRKVEEQRQLEAVQRQKQAASQATIGRAKLILDRQKQLQQEEEAKRKQQE